MQFRNYFKGRPRGSQAALYAVSLLITIFLLSTILTISFTWLEMWYTIFFDKKVNWDKICPQLPVLTPSDEYQTASHFLASSYQKKSAALLGGAVQIPTVTYDDMNNNPRLEDRFLVFKKFHKFLSENFPLTTQRLELVNTYGLLYTIDGTNSELKPTILMAHQDVVPVEQETADKWEHAPFSGYYDGEYIWGRGSLDTKSSLVAILEAIESLLAQKWVPERTVLVSFGFDEELDGSRGALHLAELIRSRYGDKDSVHMIVDEGTGVGKLEGRNFALVSVAEKGYTDIQIVVNTPGGHSSAPPDHTGIGILSELLVDLEIEYTAEIEHDLRPEDVVAETYGCIAKFGANLSSAERNRLVDTEYLSEYLGKDRYLRPFVRTTQAIDVIHGGVKLNALPEQASATVNYRIDVHESVQSVTLRAVNLAKGVAEKHKLGLVLNGEVLLKSSGSKGTIELVNGQSIEPAAISPYHEDSEPWKLLVGTSKHTLQRWFGMENITVAPALMVGNTDTWQYQGLTANVYRYTVGVPDDSGNAHTVGERISLQSHLAAVVWYYEMLQFL